MQFSDMKALQSLYTHKILFRLHPSKFPQSLSFLSRQSTKFSCQFHFTGSRLRAEDAGNAVASIQAGPDTGESGSGNGGLNGRTVWSIYSPQLGRTVTRRGAKEGDQHDIELGFSNFNKEIEDLERNLNGRDGPEQEFLGFLKENEDFEAQRTYGSAKMGTLSGGDKPHLNSWKIKGYGGTMEKEYTGYSGKTRRATLSSDSDNEGSLKEISYGSLKSKSLGDSGKTRMGLSMYRNENEDLSNQTRNGGVKKVDLVNGLRSVDTVMHRRKKKSKITWVCENCGYSDGQWWGACRECQRVGTMKQFVEGDVGSGCKVGGMEFTEYAVRSWLPQQPGDLQPLRLKQVNRGTNQLNWRIQLSGLFGNEVARVLGGGLVPAGAVYSSVTWQTTRLAFVFVEFFSIDKDARGLLLGTNMADTLFSSRFTAIIPLFPGIKKLW